MENKNGKAIEDQIFEENSEVSIEEIGIPESEPIEQACYNAAMLDFEDTYDEKRFAENTIHSEMDAETIHHLINNDPEDDDDEFILEDEFSNIPDSYFDDDIQLGDEDEASSIAALLYDDDDTTPDDDFEKHTSVSFADLKQQIQKIKDEAQELKVEEAIEEEAIEEIEESTNKVEEPVTEDIEISDDSITDVPDEGEIENSEIYEEKTEELPKEESSSSSVQEEKTEEEIKIEQAEEPVKEHVITIDKRRVKESNTSHDRLIDGVFEVVETFAFALLIIMILTTFVFKQTTVSGDSMLPTFYDGDRLVISSLFYTPKVGDVIVFDDRSKDFGEYGQSPIIKRIFAISGETVDIKNGKITVYTGQIEDNIIARECYVNGIKDMIEPVYIGEGEIFVLGDNLFNSTDSRDENIKAISVESILGKVVFRFYSNGNIVFDTKFKLGEE